jgi:DNA polymerase III delta subunit
MPSPITAKECLELTTLPPVLLLSCQDNVRANRLYGRLLEIHKGESIERIHLAALSPQSFSKLIDSLSTLSLFAATRLVAVEIPEKKNPFATELFNSLGHVPLGTSVILRFRGPFPSADQLEGLPKETRALTLEPLVEQRMEAWLAKEAQRLASGGGQGAGGINAGALRLIATYGGESLDAAFQALEQVALYADGTPISERTVQEVITVIPEAEEFALLDLIDSGSIPRAEQLSERLLTQGSNAFLLLAMIARNQMNRIAVRGGVEAKVPDDALRRSLNMTPWVYERTKKGLTRGAGPSIKEVILAIVRADTRLKGKSLGPQPILSELFTSLAPRQRRDRDSRLIPNDQLTPNPPIGASEF